MKNRFATLTLCALVILTTPGRADEALCPTPDLSRGTTNGPIYFGQRGVSPHFSSEGRFRGSDLNDVVSWLQAGDLETDDIPINFIWINGQRVAVNNRSLTVIVKAGRRPTKVIDLSGALPSNGPDSLQSVLQRLAETGCKPTKTSQIRLTKDRDSEIREQVTIVD
jgi:hypothetical protein